MKPGSERRADFPIFSEDGDDTPLVYLDSAASTQKPAVVIDALADFYRNSYANIKRGLYSLSVDATEKMEATRTRVAAFAGAGEDYVTIFVRGATEALNLLATSYAREQLQPGDEILLTEMEHHANLVPWQEVAKRRGAILKFARIDAQYRLDQQHFLDQISERTRIAAFTHASNVLGSITPAPELVKALSDRGIITIVDGCQAAPSMPINVQEIGCTAYTFSAHKMLGPTGVGLLFLNKKFAESLPPYQVGGGMLLKADYDQTRYLPPPQRFEAGTPAFAEIAAFRHALDYLDQLGLDNILEHERILTQQLLEGLEQMDGVVVYGPREASDRIGVVSFSMDDIHPHDAGMFLAHQGICVRVGHHCAQPLMRKLGTIATIRASAYVYNGETDITRLLECLKNARAYFQVRGDHI